VALKLIADQKPIAARTVSAEILSPDMLSPEFLGGHKSLDMGRRLSCEEVLRAPTPPPPLLDEPPPSLPKKEVGSQWSLFVAVVQGSPSPLKVLKSA